MKALIKPREFVTQLFSDGLIPGSIIRADTIEEVTGLHKGTVEFNFWVKAIRDVLIKRGIWLSGEGYNGEAYEILHPRENHWVVKLAAAKAIRSGKRMQTLLENTDQSQLTELEKQKLDFQLRKTRLENQLLRRANKRTSALYE
jgi:hypothetical protein